MPELQEPEGLILRSAIMRHLGSVDPAEFLPATKSTDHFMLNPRCLCSCKPFVRLDRAESLIVFYLRNVEYRVTQFLRKFFIK